MPEGKQYYIIKEHPLRIMSKCKSHSKGTLVSFLAGICMLYAFLNWIPEILSLYFPATNLDLMATLPGVDQQMLSRLNGTPLVIYVYALFFSGVVNLGEALYALTYIRNRKVEFKALTEGAPLYLKTFGIYILQLVIVAFWSIFFVIPGIVAALNFSQAYYVLADDPDKGVTQVLAESKMLMQGNRFTYIRLLLYYLPYLLFGYLPAFLLSGLIAGMHLPAAALLIISMLAELPVFAAHGYICLGRTVFYELMINEGFAYFKYAGQEAFREFER